MREVLSAGKGVCRDQGAGPPPAPHRGGAGGGARRAGVHDDRGGLHARRVLGHGLARPRRRPEAV